MSLLDRAVSFLLPAVPKPIVRYFSSRYIAGASPEEAFRVVRSLSREGAMCTLDILGEFIHSREDAEANTGAYEELARRILAEKLPETNISVKLTALGLLLDPQVCLQNMRHLLATVRAQGNFIRIDMEDSRCTTPTLEIYRALRREFPDWVGVVLQARLRRTLADAEDLSREPANFRLCKGIYIEPRVIAYTDPEIIRRNFIRVLEIMLRQGAYVGIATHDEVLVFESLRRVRDLGLGPHQYELQMLLGVDEELRKIFLAEGHRVRVYVPFGEHWYPYSIRRLRENPQLAGYAFKAMFRRA